jgi:hypothetical protein
MQLSYIVVLSTPESRYLYFRPQFTLYLCLFSSSEPVFLDVYGASALIPRNEFRQPM